jgi:hypothetical protein
MPYVFDGEWWEPIIMVAARMARRADTFPRIFRVLMAMLEVMRPPPWPRGLIATRVLPRAWRDRWLESSLLRLKNLTAQIIDEIGRYKNATNQLRVISKSKPKRLAQNTLSDTSVSATKLMVERESCAKPYLTGYSPG